jgi:hypothetical protein
MSVDQYAFDAFADSWLEDKWFMDEMTDSTAHPLMTIGANTDVLDSTVSPCAGSLTFYTRIDQKLKTTKPDFSLSPLSNRLSGSPTTLTEVFSERVQQQLPSDRFLDHAT